MKQEKVIRTKADYHIDHGFTKASAEQCYLQSTDIVREADELTRML